LWVINPSLNFRSNHVDFGAINLSSSETLISSSIITGSSEKATENFPESTSLSNSFSPLIPPTKSILLSFFDFWYLKQDQVLNPALFARPGF